MCKKDTKIKMYNLAAKKIGGLEEEVAFATFGHKLDFK